MSVFLPVPHCGGYYRAVLQFEVREEDASSCVLLFQSSWPFKVLFNISSLLGGVFLFLEKGIEYHFVISVSVFVDGFFWNGHFNSSLLQCLSVE